MNISFDLDNTLFPNGNQFQTEAISNIAEILRIEKIRKGTKNLIHDLQSQGHDINIYTTSYRTKFRIRLTLWYYGIKVKRIVNQSENQKTLNSRNIHSSKYPPAFGFDIHIDDLKGVEIEGVKYNFETIIVKPNDENWVEKIKTQLKRKTLSKTSVLSERFETK